MRFLVGPVVHEVVQVGTVGRLGSYIIPCREYWVVGSIMVLHVVGRYKEKDCMASVSVDEFRYWSEVDPREKVSLNTCTAGGFSGPKYPAFFTVT